MNAVTTGCLITRTSNGYILTPMTVAGAGTLADAKVFATLAEVFAWIERTLPLQQAGASRGGA